MKVDYFNNILKDFFLESNLHTIVHELQCEHKTEEYSDLEVYMDGSGHLLYYVPHKTTSICVNPGVAWSQRTYKDVPNPSWFPPQKNNTFVDAIKFDKINSGAARKGTVSFTHMDGRKTHMSFHQYRKLAPKLIQGWLIGKFAYNKFYGKVEIFCIEVLL